MINIWNELKSKSIINEGCLYEGTHYDREAAKILSEVCDIETAEKIIDSLIKEKSVSIFSHTNWIYKFLKPIAKIFVNEVKKGKLLIDVIDDSDITINRFLSYVKNNQEDKDLLFKFINNAELSDVEKFIQNKDAESNKINTFKVYDYSSSNYSVIKIDSYEQMHSMFGGAVTGDGKSGEAADNEHGDGATAWCHANSKDSYDIHTHRGNRTIYVIYKKDWKDIPPIKTEGFPLDKYGLSLIAIIVSRRGELLESTIRWNHIGVNNADHVFETWVELNSACKQDIQKECAKYFSKLNVETQPLFVVDETSTLIRNKYYDTFESEDNDLYQKLEIIDIPTGTIKLSRGVFSQCKNLKSITIPSTVEYISEDAFYGCLALEKLIIPDSVLKLEKLAISGCSNLTDLKLSENLTELPNKVVAYMDKLTTITIPSKIKYIGSATFYNCGNLQTAYVPKDAEIEEDAFDICSRNLQIIRY